VRGTWRKGTYTEHSEKHVMENSGKRISFIGLHKENLKHLAREGSANMFIGPEPVLAIFFCYVQLIKVCGLTFYHNTLRDISLWAQAS
jgi:hypothetical protein